MVWRETTPSPINGNVTGRGIAGGAEIDQNESYSDDDTITVTGTVSGDIPPTRIVGGIGTDTITVGAVGQYALVSGGIGDYTIAIKGGGVGSNVESIVFGDGGADTITTGAITGDADVEGGPGADVIEGGIRRLYRKQ